MLLDRTVEEMGQLHPGGGMLELQVAVVIEGSIRMEPACQSQHKERKATLRAAWPCEADAACT